MGEDPANWFMGIFPSPMAAPLIPHPLTFAEVMQRALYDPAHGYYGRSPRRIGRGGDFYTAVSVGSLYGQLLGQVAADTWQALGQPADFMVIEQGAHDGQLALDVWQHWPHPEKPHYLIVEPQPGYRQAQQQRLEPLMGARIQWAASLAELRSRAPRHAFFLCNELLDAFPVHRVRWNGTAWRELQVSPTLEWLESDLSSTAVRQEAARLPTDLPAGYTTEVHPAAVEWLREVARLGFQGSVLIADYGYEAAEYYAPERSDGTLRRYFEHQCDGKVLERLGECDLTAHINFTPLIEEGEAAGMTVQRFMDQGRFLTHAATRWLQSLEGKPMTASTASALRQFHSLTHPGHMGAAFRLLQLAMPFVPSPPAGA